MKLIAVGLSATFASLASVAFAAAPLQSVDLSGPVSKIDAATGRAVVSGRIVILGRDAAARLASCAGSPEATIKGSLATSGSVIATAVSAACTASSADARTSLPSPLEFDVQAGAPGAAGAATQGIVGTGIEGIVGTGIEGIVGTGIEGIVGTGIEGIVGTGIEGIVGTGIEGIVGTGIE